jgi:transposase-like protein
MEQSDPDRCIDTFSLAGRPAAQESGTLFRRPSMTPAVIFGTICTPCWRKWMPHVAQFMCQRGATMAELAQAFNIANSTLYEWCNQHRELHEAVQVNADAFNTRVERALAERAIGFFVTLREEIRDEKTGKVLAPAQRQYYPPDTTACIFFLKNRLREKWKDVHKVENDVRVLKSSEELRIEIRKDLLELQAQGYDPKIIDDDDAPAPPAPKRGNGSNGHG